jgi:hypothetical protein
MQCDETPWGKWYSEGNIQFIKQPSEGELIIAYYSNFHHITLSNYSSVISLSGTAFCEACSVCPLPHYFKVAVSPSSLSKMLNLGWTKI